MRYETLHPTYCHFRNPQSITATIDLHIIQSKFISKTNPSRQIQEENTNSMTIKVLWQIQEANFNYKKVYKLNKVNNLKWKEKKVKNSRNK